MAWQVFGAICAVFLMINPTEILGCGHSSCKDIYDSTNKPTSGVFYIHDNGHTIRAYCDFYEGRGYTYISKEDMGKVSNLTEYYNTRNHIIARLLYTDGTQKAVNIEPLSAYKHRYPLSFRLSGFDGFNAPVNRAMAPYIYVGLLPREFSASRTRQGYRTAGTENLFTNCDSNPNSYFAFFSNPKNLPPNGYYKRCCNTPLMRKWIDNAQLVPSGRKMPHDFYSFFEMHMGGCGGYIVTNSISRLLGAAVGLPFESEEK